MPAIEQGLGLLEEKPGTTYTVNLPLDFPTETCESMRRANVHCKGKYLNYLGITNYSVKLWFIGQNKIALFKFSSNKAFLEHPI